MNTTTETLSIYSIAREIERGGDMSAADYNLELIERSIKRLGFTTLTDPLLDEYTFWNTVRGHSVH